MVEDSLKFIWFLSKINKLGNTKIRNLLRVFNSSYDFLNCSINELRRIDGIDTNIAAEIECARKDRQRYFTEFENVLRDAERKKINIITILSKEYPSNLKHIFDAPVILYYKGILKTSDKYSLSIVGTRNPTEYGKYTCEKFTEKLSALEIPIISGFARGIDSIVHKVCINKNNLTYAVLGSGVDVIYPSENRKLYSEIIEQGAVVSEFPIGAKPDKVNFPRRNRIISGMSLGSIVIESGIKGGSLLTAEFALDQGKEVFAVPGYINSKQSEGTNEIIKKGQAKLITCVDDILSELEHKLKPVLKKEMFVKEAEVVINLNEAEKKIYDVLGYELKHIDSINEESGLPISDCLVNLLSLEFKGVIRQSMGKNFIRV